MNTFFIVVLAIAAIVVQIIIIVKFFQMAKDLHFLRKEYEVLKITHRLGEYTKAKGTKMFAVGEKAYAIELDQKVEIAAICKDGEYLCKYNRGPVESQKKISGDKLSDVFPENQQDATK
jgi:hypothetical protein